MSLAPRTIKMEKNDEITLQYLGAAVVLQWTRLPQDMQKSILQQAAAVGGLSPLTSLSEQLTALIERTHL
jgi:hypothetical protein